MIKISDFPKIERKKIYDREWKHKNKDKVRQYNKRDYEKRKQRYLQLAKERYEKFGEKIRHWNAEYNRNRHKQFKLKVFTHYGGNPPRCNCCGEMEFDFLTIDHKNEDGAKHRRNVNQARIYKDLIDNSFPEGYQILCINCNFARSFPHNKGICPHKKVK